MTAIYVNLARAFAAVATLAIYPLTKVLPNEAAWENRVIENFQVAVLILGCVAAIGFCVRSQGRWKWLWLVHAMVWFLLAGREIGWGASFYPRTQMTYFDGPLFSARELWYWPVIYPLIGVLIVATIVLTAKHRVWQKYIDIVRERSAPIMENLLALILLVIALSAEGQAGPLNYLVPHSIVLEELAELAAYIWLFAAQFVIEHYRVQKTLIT